MQLWAQRNWKKEPTGPSPMLRHSPTTPLYRLSTGYSALDGRPTTHGAARRDCQWQAACPVEKSQCIAAGKCTPLTGEQSS